MNSRRVAVLIVTVMLGGLAGCSLPVLQPTADATQPAQYGTVAAMLTQTAFQQTPSPIVTAAPTDPSPATPEAQATTPAAASPTLAQAQATATVLCDIARAGVPIDVTIPDDTHLHPGETFVKTWRLANAGSCTWTRNYAVVWFSGDDLGVRRAEPFGLDVPPGGAVDLSVDMVAPETPGTYQSNWKLRNESGALFGIGPGGGAPFWVRIQVVAVDTLTPTAPPPTPTATPMISSSGEASLSLENGLDLDTGLTGGGPGVDLFLQSTDGALSIAPASGAKVALFGVVEPAFDDCTRAALSAEPVALMAELQGFYLCTETNLGLPGNVKLNRVDAEAVQLDLSFKVWSVP